ncbi:MAG: VWA domain-containing protein [Candidatus Nanoarchaeia archaeon]|nr:VWA domain-containing protein [Candidatus Nanoarchaeia archaeon]MDD5054507.1 VWA domain-containing protein [Candidatus Nanoarchaeia archaeon]
MNKLNVSNLKEYLSKNGWSLDSDYNIRDEETDHLITACISVDDWKININLNNYDEKIEELIKNSRIKTYFDTSSLTDDVAKAVTTHEIGHYKYCPRSNNNFADILSGISKAISESPHAQNLINNKFSIANMFTDIIANATCSLELKKDFFNNGQSIFYIFEGYLAQKKGFKLPEDYALFSAINMNIIQPNNSKRNIMRDYYPSLDELLISKGLMIFTGFNQLDFADNQMLSRALINLYDESKFLIKAYEFTKLIASFIKNSPSELENLVKSNDFIERFKNDKEFNKLIKRLIIERNGNTTALTALINSIEFSDTLYWSKAKEYNIEFNLDELDKLDIICVGEEPWTGDLSNIDLVNLKPNEAGVWKFQQCVKKEPIVIRNKADFDFPDILYLFDTSGSMQGNPYDLLLTAIYASLYYLEEIGKAGDMHFNFTQFSNQTITSGWFDYYALEDKRKQFLFSPQWGGTTINYNSIKHIFDSARGPFHTILVTDGCISNENSIIELFREKLDFGSSLDYISIGGYNGAFMRLAEEHLNAKCSIINNANDIVNLIIGITRKVFSE